MVKVHSSVTGTNHSGLKRRSRSLGVSVVVLALFGCGEDGGLNPFRGSDPDGASTESEQQSPFRQTAGGDRVSTLDTRALADRIVNARLDPAKAGAILLVDIVSMDASFHSGSLQPGPGTSSETGGTGVMTYEVRGIVSDSEGQPERDRRDGTVTLTVASFIPARSLDRLRRIRVIAETNAVEIHIR